MMTPRKNKLYRWLVEHCKLKNGRLEEMTGDASFRRYFRVFHDEGVHVAMDAPPDRENTIPFIAIANALREKGLHTPDILASDVVQGFLLLTDFGDQLYLKVLNPQNAEKLYDTALDALAILQSIREVKNWEIPIFTADFMYQELNLAKEWFFIQHLNLTLSPSTEKMLDKCFHFLTESIATQPYVFMHRDYHAANLMVLPENQIGLLDFQDAFIGPVTYDLASLLRDCYIAWPEEFVTHLVCRYQEKIKMNHPDFLKWFDLMSIQRHLKALLTFSRKYRRDQNSNYLQHIPRTLNYLLHTTARYDEMQFLRDFLEKIRMDKKICAP